MTSPAVLLCYVLVCSTCGLALDQTVDNKISKRRSIMEPMHGLVKKAVNNIDLIETRTNVHNNIVNSIENLKYETGEYGTRANSIDEVVKFDDIYAEQDEIFNTNVHGDYVDKLRKKNTIKDFTIDFIPKKRVKRDDEQDMKCESFNFDKNKKYITHPHDGENKKKYYYSHMDCVTVISGAEGEVVQLTFVDMFHIEYHPECSYDYLEIRDGKRGYAKLLGKVCGEAFPRTYTTTGPHAWLKFHSDDTIEYEGFRIDIKFIRTPTSYSIPDSCYKELPKGSRHAIIVSNDIDKDCSARTVDQDLDFLWNFTAPLGHKIYLNFTQYTLAKPNECEHNFVEIFGHVLESDARLVLYCGSVANPVTSKGIEGIKDGDDKGNIMFVRLYTSKVGKSSFFNASFIAYRTLDTTKDGDKCDEETEFDCEDNTCIDKSLKCDNTAQCRLKADEEKDRCSSPADSMIDQTHIKVILIIFCLILSGMTFVFFFKCIKKLYEDHKIIKEHIRQSCEDRLDMVSSRLTLDAKRLQRDSEPRASLERDNQTNEMFKQQRKFSQQKIRPTSIDSDYIQETQLDLDDDEPWRREVESIPVEQENVRIERNGRSRRSESKKEESIKSKKESVEKKQIRDVSVGAPDTKESGCQTRESLFQTDPAISSDGSGTTNSRGFSTFGYSGATIARPSPPQTNTSQITIELLRQATEKEEKSQKKYPDRRPMSTETTRSAPDVIIVSKPIR
ncbi:hypothetical protein KGM_214928 [Danaus plexippus plexippus]|uniref:Uncharacterized protein n=1 Tax=Danaus plexippus plexippus TaxID=278856 RepID=A0A212EI20_DANPL|nr:uncharacterized protein LOC116775224 [Danaus plexippus plexippus]OWR41125.1 hypothetical protein KGM_214928 [Danaus plexippus plexippus]